MARKPAPEVACTDYLAGVADMLVSDNKFCPSVGVSPKQVVDVVRQYLTAFPERRHYAAASLVADALAANGEVSLQPAIDHGSAVRRFPPPWTVEEIPADG
jgi:hypothetical protein